jgi:Rieske Fe-S protein
MSSESDDSDPQLAGTGEQRRERRTFLTTATSIAMTGGLVAGYGTFAGMAARYLYPAGPAPTAWLFVADLSRFQQGASMVYRAPSGAPIVIARRGDTGTEADFIALSSTCPHLGCQVHWEAQNDRFFCPCHNGIFDPSGKAISGPPADAGQSLLRYPTKVEGGLLFIEVPTDQLALGPGRIEDPALALFSRPRGPGHDPCLHARPALVPLTRPAARAERA